MNKDKLKALVEEYAQLLDEIEKKIEILRKLNKKILHAAKEVK